MESGLDNVLKRKYETRSSRNAIPMNAKLEQQSPQECDTQHNASRSSLTYGLNNDATTHGNRARTTNNMRKTPLERSYMIIDKNSGTFVTETFDKKKIFPTASASSDAKETSQNDSDLNLKKYVGERRLKSNGGISAGSHTKQTSFSSVNDNDATTDGFPVVFGSQQQILALYQGTSSKSNKFRKNSNSFGSGQISSPHKSESSHAPYLDPFSLEQKAEKLFPFFNEDDTQSSTDNSEMEFDWHEDSLTSNRPTSWSDTPITERPLLSEDDFQPDLNKTVKVTDIDSLFLAQNDISKDVQDDGSNARETFNEVKENGEVKLSPEMGDLEDELALFSESLWEDMNDMEINSNSPQVEETITPVDSPRDNINVHDLFLEDCPNESIIVPVNKHKQVFQEFVVEESLSSTQAADDVGLSDMNQTTTTFTQDDETDNKMTSQKVKSTTDDVISDKVNCSDRSTPSHGQCDVINTFDGKTIDGCHGDAITHDPYDYEESNVSSHSDTDVCSNVDVDIRSHRDFSGDVSAGSHGDASAVSHGDVSVDSHGDVSVGSHGDVSVGSHGDASVGDVNVSSHDDVNVDSHGDVSVGSHGDVSAVSHGDASVDDVKVCSHGDVSVGSHSDISVGSHNDVSVGSHGDAIVGSHGDASVGSHGDANVDSHGDVNVRSHGDASVGSHGDASVCSHGDAIVGSHGDASVGSHGDASVCSHDDVDIGSHGDASVSRHGDAVVDCSDIFIDVEGPPTIKDDALSSGFDGQQSSDYSGVKEEANQHELYIDGETLLKPTVAHGDFHDNIAIQEDKEGESSGEDCPRNGKDAINRNENKTLPQDNQSDTADNNLYNSDHKVNNGNDREFIQYNGEVNSDINITKEPEVKGKLSKYGDDVSKESDVIILIDNVDGNDTNDSGPACIGLNENDLKLRRKSSDSDSEHLRILKSTSPDHTITSEFFSGKVSPVGVPPRPSHDGGNKLPLNERILNVNRSIDWVRSVIMEMRSQDLMLKIQFDGLREEIRNLKHEFEHYGVGCDYYNDEELSNIEVLNQKTVKSKSHLKANTAVREDSGYQSDASDPKDDGKGNVAKAKYLYEPIPSFPKVQTLPSNKCVFEFVL